MAITKDKTQTERSEQNVLSKSYDKDFSILAVEMVGYDGTNLRRIAVTAAGALKVVL